MKFKKIALLAIVAGMISLSACGPKDEAIQKSIQEKLTTMAPGVSAQVQKGVVTLSGEFIDDATKASVEAALKEIKGVKSITDNAVIKAAEVVAPVVVNGDEVLKAGVATALQAFPAIASNVLVLDSIITLTGEIKKADLPKVMQALMALHPKKVENKATIK